MHCLLAYDQVGHTIGKHSVSLLNYIIQDPRSDKELVSASSIYRLNIQSSIVTVNSVWPETVSGGPPGYHGSWGIGDCQMPRIEK